MNVKKYSTLSSGLISTKSLEKLVFYQAVFESLTRYNITAWFGELSVQLKSKLVRVIQTAWKVIGVRPPIL